MKKAKAIFLFDIILLHLFIIPVHLLIFMFHLILVSQLVEHRLCYQ